MTKAPGWYAEPAQILRRVTEMGIPPIQYRADAIRPDDEVAGAGGTWAHSQAKA